MAYRSTPSAAERSIRFAISVLDKSVRDVQRPSFDTDQREQIALDFVRDVAVVVHALGDAAEKITRWAL